MGYRPWQDSGITTVTNGQVDTKVSKSYYNGSYGLNAQWTVWNGNRNRNQMVEVGKMSKADLAQLSAQRATDEYNLVEARATFATISCS